MISIVVPLFNEEESLPSFYKELYPVLKAYKSYELIFIDDGSTDSSLLLLKKFSQKDKHIKIFSFRKNQGKAEALTFGFQIAKGDYIITLDADLQDRPDQIKKMLVMAKKGYDLTCGWRKNRKDSVQKIISSKIFNYLVGLFWGLHLNDYNCGLKVYSCSAAKSLDLYGGLHRFIPILAYQQGFSVCEIPIIHEKRRFGKSKYGFSKLWKDLPDMFTMFFLIKYSLRPLHFFGPVGLTLFLFGIVILIYLTILKLRGEGIGDRPLLFLGILLLLSGLQVLFTGFLADLLINTSHKNDREIPVKYSTEQK